MQRRTHFCKQRTHWRNVTATKITASRGNPRICIKFLEWKTGCLSVEEESRPTLPPQRCIGKSDIGTCPNCALLSSIFSEILLFSSEKHQVPSRRISGGFLSAAGWSSSRQQSPPLSNFDKALTDTSKFGFGLPFWPLSQFLPQRIWEAI